MVIVKITGGLGNQLFQYAFGQYLLKLLKTDVKYKLQTNISMNNFSSRSFALLDFNFQVEVAKKEDVERMKLFSYGLCSRFERKLTQKLPTINKHFFVEDDLHKVLSVDELKDDCYYDGYWQSFKYQENNDINVNKEIYSKYLSIVNSKLAEKISSCNSISIHIRRGDYISIKKNTDIFNICNMDYYFSAIEFIENKVIEPQYFVFSDDIEWAKTNFIGSKFIFIEGNSPTVDMFLMSLCKHNIIANSTFSWWAAWFNKNSKKEIICPKYWYVNRDNLLKEFIPESWIRL